MPCTYTGNPDGDRIMSLEESNSELGVELDLATRILCEVSRKMKSRDMTAEHLAWWKEHQKRDRDRLKREKKERTEQHKLRTALNKLTPEEKKLLNLGGFE